MKCCIFKVKAQLQLCIPGIRLLTLSFEVSASSAYQFQLQTSLFNTLALCSLKQATDSKAFLEIRV